MLNWIVLNGNDYLHKMHLALNSQQRLICHKTQPINQPTNSPSKMLLHLLLTSSGKQSYYSRAMASKEFSPWLLSFFFDLKKFLFFIISKDVFPIFSSFFYSLIHFNLFSPLFNLHVSSTPGFFFFFNFIRFLYPLFKYSHSLLTSFLHLINFMFLYFFHFTRFLSINLYPFVYIYLSIYLSIYRRLLISNYLIFFMYTYRSINLNQFTFITISTSVCSSISLSIYQHINQAVNIYIYI